MTIGAPFLPQPLGPQEYRPGTLVCPIRTPHSAGADPPHPPLGSVLGGHADAGQPCAVPSLCPAQAPGPNPITALGETLGQTTRKCCLLFSMKVDSSCDSLGVGGKGWCRGPGRDRAEFEHRDLQSTLPPHWVPAIPRALASRPQTLFPPSVSPRGTSECLRPSVQGDQTWDTSHHK